jgi:hypothetical protein
MKFEKILLILLIEFFIVGSASRGYAAGGNSAAAEASLGGYEQSLGTPSGDQAAGALPQWRLSLAEIQIQN